MQGSVDVNSRPNLSIIPDDDEVAVKEDTSIVDEPVATNAHVYAVIAHERGLDLCAAPDLSE